MSLPRDKLEAVPEIFEVRDCYRRIYEWHVKHGREKIKAGYGREDIYSETYLELLDALPSPGKATAEDMAFIFGEVLGTLMEWADREEDDYGIKTGAYAQFALNKFFNGSIPQLEASAKKSKLYSRFAFEKWRLSSFPFPK